MYEMLYGVTPYRGKDERKKFNISGKSQDDTFSQILSGEIKFPEHHSHPVRPKILVDFVGELKLQEFNKKIACA